MPSKNIISFGEDTHQDKKPQNVPHHQSPSNFIEPRTKPGSGQPGSSTYSKPHPKPPEPGELPSTEWQDYLTRHIDSMPQEASYHHDHPLAHRPHDGSSTSINTVHEPVQKSFALSRAFRRLRHAVMPTKEAPPPSVPEQYRLRRENVRDPTKISASGLLPGSTSSINIAPARSSPSLGHHKAIADGPAKHASLSDGSRPSQNTQRYKGEGSPLPHDSRNVQAQGTSSDATSNYAAWMSSLDAYIKDSLKYQLSLNTLRKISKELKEFKITVGPRASGDNSSVITSTEARHYLGKMSSSASETVHESQWDPEELRKTVTYYDWFTGKLGTLEETLVTAIRDRKTGTADQEMLSGFHPHFHRAMTEVYDARHELHMAHSQVTVSQQPEASRGDHRRHGDLTRKPYTLLHYETDPNRVVPSKAERFTLEHYRAERVKAKHDMDKRDETERERVEREKAELNKRIKPHLAAAHEHSENAFGFFESFTKKI